MRRALGIGAVAIAVVAVGAWLAREKLTAATLPPRAAHLTPLESPGAARYTCETSAPDVNASLAAFGVPPGTHSVTYRFGDRARDARELSALLDGEGRLLAFSDDARHGSDSGGVSLVYTVGRQDDGTFGGTRTRQTDRTREDGAERSHTMTTRSDSLTAAELAKASVVIAWLAAHRCDTSAPAPAR